MAGGLPGFCQAFIDLIFPLRCASCKRKIGSTETLPLCAGCWHKLRKNAPPFCRSCGKTVGKVSLERGLCARCAGTKPHFDRAYSLFLYEGPAKALVREFKYRGKDHLAPLLGKQMVSFIKENGVSLNFIDCVVPVPLHPAKLREREFNQALLLAQAIAKEMDRPVTEALSRTRNTRTQTNLKPEKRHKNVKGAFAVRKGADVKNKNVLLIDDVLTTGATASEAAQALKNAGARMVVVMTLAN
ncbi:MAG: ComF family protein [Deltaproteobacteria bacterium]